MRFIYFKEKRGSNQTNIQLLILMIPYLVHPFQEIKVTQKNQRWLNTDGAVSVPVEAVTTLRAASLGQSHYSRGEERCFGRPEAHAVQQRYLVKG